MAKTEIRELKDALTLGVRDLQNDTCWETKYNAIKVSLKELHAAASLAEMYGSGYMPANKRKGSHLPPSILDTLTSAIENAKDFL